MDKRLVKISKYLAKVLRHNPERIGLMLDAQGWAKVDDIIRLSNNMMTRDEIEDVVAMNDKRRYALSEDGQFIRANQGHSIAVDLQLNPVAPPEILYHGTASKNLESIRETGLVRMSRQYVHLSSDHNTAIKVGGRHGKPMVLSMYAGRMQEAGHAFYLSANGVWLTEIVPANFIELPSKRSV
ncbi:MULTISPECIES: RNA 2'-phosphotransferase [unclassified Roseovarius]|uniref:RNA 2'-phosphotransferase n=1 Tax=unclassified Roseovarius TaxID=2614913 RepID=UPI00273D41C8|nr:MULTISPECIES: RNA 2'-phosphotransferase [unclassified Roseovarius]